MKALTSSLLAAAALLVAPVANATTVKALSFAVNEALAGRNQKAFIKEYIVTNGVDFGAFDCAKATNYFLDSDFSQDGKNFKVVYYNGGSYKYFVYSSDKYELVNTPLDDRSGDCMTAVFQDEFGSQYALISIRNNYTAAGVKSYLAGITNKFPLATLIVTYNQRVGTSNANTLHASLVDSDTGPGLTCLGRTDVDGTAVGGVYMAPAGVPSAYSVSLVPSSIGTTYNGTLATLEFPDKYRVIFVDWDGTGLQTNIVVAGGSVTPPTPVRPGYTFIGWNHDASEFASVSESFTATAQYDVPTLTVSGDPSDLGTADPAYGTTTAIAANDSFTASVPPPAAAAGAPERWICTGYTHYRITDLATGAKTVEQAGDSASFAYTHVWRDELVWHFTNEWLVSVSATAGGTVSAGDTWVRNAATFPLVATPEEGYELWRWLGDTDGLDATATSIEPTITAARSLKAVFVPIGADAAVQHVAETGDDANDGYLPATPKRTVQAAVDTLAAAPGYGTVHVAAGTYASSKGLVVTNAIAVLGETGNPEDVILRNTSTGASANVITLRLNHTAAFVANLVVENGHRYQPQGTPYGANLAIESSGGTVSNCILRGGVCHHFYPRGAGAWLNSDAALLTHCVVTNNSGNGTSKQREANDGMFVHVAKGTVDNCLIAYNKDTGTAVNADIQACGVTIHGGRLLNCTVVTNEARYTGGVYLGSGAVAKNVVVAGCVNKSTHTNSVGQLVWTDVGFAGSLANASHCASDGGEELDATCVAGTAATFFRDPAAGDWRPKQNSPLLDKGVSYAGIAAVDLLGNRRSQGHPDIGCFENPGRCTIIVVR